MKKLFAFLLSLVLLFTFTACEKEDLDLALDIAWAVLEELDDQPHSHTCSCGGHCGGHHHG